MCVCVCVGTEMVTIGWVSRVDLKSDMFTSLQQQITQTTICALTSPPGFSPTHYLGMFVWVCPVAEWVLPWTGMAGIFWTLLRIFLRPCVCVCVCVTFFTKAEVVPTGMCVTPVVYIRGTSLSYSPGRFKSKLSLPAPYK